MLKEHSRELQWAIWITMIIQRLEIYGWFNGPELSIHTVVVVLVVSPWLDGFSMQTLDTDESTHSCLPVTFQGSSKNMEKRK